jgi:hypothetical protein
MKIKDIIETATAGATASGNIATVVNPHIAIGNKKQQKNYAGSPGKIGKSPKHPKPKKQKPTDNALNMKGTSLFGGPMVKR